MPLSLDEIRAVIADAVAPHHFFVGNGLELEWEHTPAETIPWEIYKGRLLDASQTREKRTFEAWNIFSTDEFGRSLEPLLSVKLDAEAGQIHVVRAILCYAWEAYDAGDNVILSRETTKWVRELVRTIDPKTLNFAWEKAPEIACILLFRSEVPLALFQAVVGTSRLPLTSIETPLPMFSLGRLAYFYRLVPSLRRSKRSRLRRLFASVCGKTSEKQKDGPPRTWHDLVEGPVGEVQDWLGKVKLLETFLHAISMEQLPEAAEKWLDRVTSFEHRELIKFTRDSPRPKESVRTYLKELVNDPARVGRESATHLLRALFNEAALTPYTDLVDKALALMQALEVCGRLRAEDVADVLGHLLRQLGRHLTAYDLITFHHRGANYPDALLLDAVMKAYLRLMDREPALFSPSAGDDENSQRRKRLRRRALRQGWLLRRQYELLRVPDAPTSPGENLRVLPPPHVRVPEEQFLYVDTRTNRLYQDDPLDKHLTEQTKTILRQSIEDLSHPMELCELGTATFLDRPFGGGKSPTEPDSTLLFSYVAFSRSIAHTRLRYLAIDMGLVPDPADQVRLESALAGLEVRGVPVHAVTKNDRQTIVSLADALKVSEDFVIIRNTIRAWSKFGIQYLLDSALKHFSLDHGRSLRPMLIIRDTPPGSQRETLSIYDSRHRKRIELDFDPAMGYVSRGGYEYPASPLQILRVWEGDEAAEQLRERDLSADPILLQPPRW